MRPLPTTGEVMTTASWIRKFVTSHPDYHQDSVVSDKVTYDLMRHMRDISEGVVPCPELTGKLASKTPQQYKALRCPPVPSEIVAAGMCGKYERE